MCQSATIRHRAGHHQVLPAELFDGGAVGLCDGHYCPPQFEGASVSGLLDAQPSEMAYWHLTTDLEFCHDSAGYVRPPVNSPMARWKTR